MGGFDVARWIITSIHIIPRICSPCQAAPLCGAMSHRFGEKLRALRTRQGLTQAQLAEQLGLATQSHLSYLENGKSTPSMGLVVRAATALGVTLDYLLRDAIPVAPPLFSSSASWSENNIAQQFGRRLRFLRLQQGLSQMQLAEHLQPLSQAHISFLETGHKAPSVETVLRCADLFRVAVDDLLQPSAVEGIGSESEGSGE